MGACSSMEEGASRQAPTKRTPRKLTRSATRESVGLQSTTTTQTKTTTTTMTTTANTTSTPSKKDLTDECLSPGLRINEPFGFDDEDAHDESCDRVLIEPFTPFAPQTYVSATAYMDDTQQTCAPWKRPTPRSTRRKKQTQDAQKMINSGSCKDRPMTSSEFLGFIREYNGNNENIWDGCSAIISPMVFEEDPSSPKSYCH